MELTRELAGEAEQIEARVRLGSEEQTCTMPRPAAWVPAAEPEPEPPAAAVEPRRVHVLVGAQLGASSNFGKVSGPWGALHVAATGSRLGLVAARMLTPRVLWSAAALALLAWGYKWITWTA